jgi:hypothetical protein
MVMQKIGFTGTQQGMTATQMAALRQQLSDMRGAEFHHGDCIGADAQAHDIAVELGLIPVVHPPVDPSKRAFKPSTWRIAPLPYLSRNAVIVGDTEMLIAAPAEFKEKRRSGTWSTVRQAQRTLKPFIIIYPDGAISGGGESL